MCNREVKFGAFYRWAKEQGADFIATGHYAQIENNQLKKSVDIEKDQTYFLWALSQDVLTSVIFPVGGLEKKKVRELAEKYNLPVSTKKDSQGLCFVGTIDVKTLLKTYIDEKRGDVLNSKGDVIGYHDGVMFYTIGERHRFTITKKSTEDKPYFIIAKDMNKNTLTVSHEMAIERQNESIELEKVNWTSKPLAGKVYEARARYRAPLSKVQFLDETRIKVIGEEFLIASGQSLVVYDDEVCIGGGILYK
jgi:tRNA-specific 2-thiouridylase